MKYCVVLIFLVFGLSSSNAQIDSLRVIWTNEEVPDTIRLNAGFELASWFVDVRGNVDSSDFYLNQVIELSEINGDSLMLGQALLKSGDNASWHSGEEAMERYKRALTIYQEVGNEKMQATAMASMGMTYYGLGDLNKTVHFSNKALMIAEKYDYWDCLAFCFLTQAYVAGEFGDKEAERSAYVECYNMIDSLSDPTIVSMTLDALAELSLDLKEYRQGLRYFEEIKARGITPHPGVYSSASSCYKALADSAIAANNSNLADEYYDKALAYTELSVQASKSAGKPNYWLGWAYVGQAQIYYARKQYSLALEKAKLANDLAQEIDLIRISWLSSKVLKQIHEAQGNYKLALKYAQRQAALSDSIASNDQLKKAAQAEVQFEFDRKEFADSLAQVEVERLEAEEAERIQATKNRRNNLQYSGIIILVLALGMIIAYSGRINMSPNTAEGLIFIFFLLLFEFILVVMDPYVDNWSGGEVAVKLAINSFFALLVFFGHRFFEGKLKTVLAERRAKQVQSAEQTEE